ncbi:hypothetical protein RUM43_014761 [Polyplax serrata]|uniref:Uncharacterized protein n=1 Tax=Polyplax serrata TaxID=468196 RepID=A0AAN8S9H5_POLSC
MNFESATKKFHQATRSEWAPPPNACLTVEKSTEGSTCFGGFFGRQRCQPWSAAVTGPWHCTTPPPEDVWTVSNYSWRLQHLGE